MKMYKKIRDSVLAFRRMLRKEKELIRQEREKKIEKYYTLNNVELENSVVGDFSYISNNSIVHNCIIGKYCSIGPNVVIGFGEHPISHISTSPIFYAAEQGMCGENFYSQNKFENKPVVKIGNDVWIGANVFIKNGISIGHGAVIGAGSVVTKSVPAYAVVVGVPAKVIRYRFSEEKINKLIKLKWWDFELSQIREQRELFCTPDFDQIFNL